MRSWRDITLYQYQQIEDISRRTDLSEMDKSLFDLCAVYDISEYQLDKMNVVKVSRMSERLRRIIESEFVSAPKHKIGWYHINYNIEDTRFGQYVELNSFFRDKERVIARTHYILASISHIKGKKNDSNEHAIKSEYFLNIPVTDAVGTVKEFAEHFSRFNKKYEPVSEDSNPDDAASIQHPFNRRYGWIYNATLIAEHERITLDQVFDLPTPHALNDLAYLKSHNQYLKEKT